MLYLLDANVPITANNTYYAIDQVPEFWEWLQYQGTNGRIKMPLEMMLRPSKFEGHCPMIRHGCRMALMVAL
ncbi:MAG: protein of unknown function (DUF4411), partial [Candidatus Kentron sp. G]